MILALHSRRMLCLYFSEEVFIWQLMSLSTVHLPDRCMDEGPGWHEVAQELPELPEHLCESVLPLTADISHSIDLDHQPQEVMTPN